MTMKDTLTLRHDKYIAYMQILSGFVIALIAAQYFNLFEIKIIFFEGVIKINNFVAGIIIGAVGLYFFRRKLRQIETEIKNEF